VSVAGEKCSTCGTLVPAGAVRCPGCGRVFGEDNRCPHCNAIAAVRVSGDGYVCSACSKPRERKPLTTVLGDSPGRISMVPSASSMRGRGLRALGTFSIGGGVVAAALATAVLGVTVVGVSAAAVAGLAGVLLGLLFLRRASRADESTRAFDERAAGARVLAAATKLGGDVTAKAVAESLGVSVEEADRVLTKMTDGSTVSVEVDTDDGSLHYVFHEVVEARKAKAPQVRIADEVGRGTDPDVDAAAVDQAELEALKERKSRI
jgi:hypothetical protein